MQRKVVSYPWVQEVTGEVHWEYQGRTSITGRKFWHAVDEAGVIHAHTIAISEDDPGPVAEFETAQSRLEAQVESAAAIYLLIEHLNINGPLVPDYYGISEGPPFSHDAHEPEREIRHSG